MLAFWFLFKELVLVKVNVPYNKISHLERWLANTAGISFYFSPENIPRILSLMGQTVTLMNATILLTISLGKH